MKQAMQESSNTAASHSFLLDDDSAIPFTHADVERMVDDKVGDRRGGGGQPVAGGVLLPDLLPSVTLAHAQSWGVQGVCQLWLHQMKRERPSARSVLLLP
jgi:hypothetical protein